MQTTKTESTSSREVIHRISSELQMPKVYKCDLEADALMIQRTPGVELIWSLRETGTAMAIVKVGMDPAYISSFEAVAYYHITSDRQFVKINRETAIMKMNEMPALISARMSKEELVDAVNGVISKGCDFKVWGVFSNPSFDSFKSWSDWRKYFQDCGNDVMSEFMTKACRFYELAR